MFLCTLFLILLSFNIAAADPYDILFNEIMEDPNISGDNTLGLPNIDYIELYNRSDQSIVMESFSLKIGSKILNFPAYTIAPKAYLLLCKTNAEAALENYGSVLAFSNFPSLTSSQELILEDMFGVVIDALEYNQEWYRSSSKAAGGYSLERINPLSPCEGSSNWTASEALIGGTPGRENSVLRQELDLTRPAIINAYPISPKQIRLTFSEAMAEEPLLSPSFFSLEGNFVTQIQLSKSNFSEVLIELENDLVPNEIQELKLLTGIKDCVGNAIPVNYFTKIAFPVKAGIKDILINEVLFNPEVRGKDFLELYNNSDKVIDLHNLVLINQLEDEPVGKPILSERLLFPHSYIVLTESPVDIASRYNVLHLNVLIQQDLPNFPDDAGNITLFTNDFATNKIIDQFDYSKELHSSLLVTQDGVSLERLRFDLATQDAANWHSASATVGYASPTALNSQAINIAATSTNTFFTFSNKTISPDGDGFADFLQINYSLDQAGYSANVHIYDAGGQLVRKLVQNELLNTSGAFNWYGTSADGQKVPIGIYVVWIDYFSVSGTKGHFKEAIVIAGKL